MPMERRMTKSTVVLAEGSSSLESKSRELTTGSLEALGTLDIKGTTEIGGTLGFGKLEERGGALIEARAFFCRSRAVIKMNHCAIQKNAFAACDEMRSSVAISDRKNPLVCPKPRRLDLFNHTINDPIKPLRWYLSHQTELCDSKAGTELLDIILTKGSATQVASSPPFFCGSPPSRAANPVIQDARFGEEKLTPLSPMQIPVSSGLSSSPSSSARKGGCVRTKFGHKPAAVRIEGFEFDCLDRDRRNCSIPAVA
ncbi:hypothetical protein HHK36_030026 [Tetracentron sinense]|uniref:Uncharacterized protein n=1 Tax=Tetracentron sinense TaxID=13715 RepID=A0A834YEY7_TETSI|nr:hypothetical protein HHK36_030026 [Tetracentron sinense]